MENGLLLVKPLRFAFDISYSNEIPRKEGLRAVKLIHDYKPGDRRLFGKGDPILKVGCTVPIVQVRILFKNYCFKFGQMHLEHSFIVYEFVLT